MKQFGPAIADAAERRQALRRDIARLRRRLDRRANRLLAPTMIISNCRENLARYPGRSILAAVCLGSFVWGGLPRDWNIRAGAARIKKWMVGTCWEELWETVKQAVAVEPCRDSKNGSEE